MNVSDERTQSLWMETEVAPRTPALRENVRADVVVIGSGIAGLSAAYELLLQGLTVVVLDRGGIGCGMTARTTAHLSSFSDDGMSELIKVRGEEVAKLWHESQAASIDRIEAICNEEAISCKFRRLDGLLFPDIGSEPSKCREMFEEEMEAAKKIGARLEKTSGTPFKDLTDVPTLRYPNQATFHPAKYLRGLVEVIRKKGGKLYAHSAVTKVDEHQRGVVVTTASGHTVQALNAIIATNSPINDRVAIHTKQGPYRTYAMSFTIPRDELPDKLYWDTADPYHYVRLQSGPGETDYLIVGGADHESGGADDGGVRFEALESWTRSLVPNLGNETHRWSGQVLEPLDYAAFIGRNPGNERIYIATGDSGQGMTHGVVAAMLLKDLIVQGSSPWQDVYEPTRTVPAGSWVGNNIGAFGIFSEYVAPGEISSYDELERGKGAIVRQGLKKVAAYRDDGGKLHLRSAVCTHMGCHLHWNSTERCWDCPCHGSHFSVDGAVLNGPAMADLEPIEPEQSTRERQPARTSARKPARNGEARKRRAS
jgi:glycine/D-amino acid oxidase-like deaminating enzyme/nitrite reductase/ring-hydroxylating ferredoxin subunit